MILGYIGVSEGIRIQNDEISGKAGLYFDHINYVWFTPYSWDIVTYVDLKPVQDLYDTLLKGITRLEQECKAIKDFTWFHKTDCEQGLTDIRSRKFGVQRLKATLEEIIGPNQQRRKRSVLGFVGELFRILFGTATEAEIETYKRKMDQMQAEQLKFLQLSSDQLTILKSSLISINETVTEVTLNEEEIIKNFETFTNAWREKWKETLHENDVITKINLIIKRIELGYHDCFEYYTLLITMVVNGRQGIIQPQVITYAKIKSLLANAVPPELQLPPFPNDQVDQILTATIFKSSTSLVYRVKVPLVQREKFSLYEMIPFPIKLPNNKTSKFIQPHVEYIATNAIKTKYAYLNQRQIDQCKKAGLKYLVCIENVPINLFNTRDCITGLVHPSTQVYPEECINLEQYMMLSETIWIPLAQSNEWLYVTSQVDDITFVCDDEVKEKVKLYIRGKLVLPIQCKGITSVGMLFPIKHEVMNHSTTDIIPLVPMDIDCCLTKMEEEVVPKIKMSLPYPNILSSTSDFKYMGIRIDDIQQQIKREEDKIEYQSFWYSYSTWFYCSTVFGISIALCLCCCCCSSCRKCGLWLLRYCIWQNVIRDRKKGCSSCCRPIIIKNQQYGQKTTVCQNDSDTSSEDEHENIKLELIPKSKRQDPVIVQPIRNEEVSGILEQIKAESLESLSSKTQSRKMTNSLKDPIHWTKRKV